MAEPKPTTIASTTTNTAAQRRSMAAKPNEAAYVSERLHRHYDRLYMLHTLAETALESLDYSTDTDIARAMLTGMLEMVRADLDEIVLLAKRAGDTTGTADTTQVTTAPAGMEA